MASPIDYEADKGKGWKEELLFLCKNDRSIGFYDPFAPYHFNNVDDHIATYIHDINMAALERADGVVCRYMKGQASVGTPIEIYHVMNDKPIVIITDMLDSVYLRYICTGRCVEIVRDVPQAYGKIGAMGDKLEMLHTKNSDIDA